ncbi:MAG: hypothetical protein ACI9F9_000948 [Candidatus Paceibacteria bacterium]|jgi:hypothetical protein
MNVHRTHTVTWNEVELRERDQNHSPLHRNRHPLKSKQHRNWIASLRKCTGPEQIQTRAAATYATVLHCLECASNEVH